MSVIRISHPTGKIEGAIQLDGSKSISNRALIIKALCKKDISLVNLSSCDDTTILNNLLFQNEGNIYDVGHAGTSFRFLTAFLAIQPDTQFLTGSERMLERPIGPLVNALNNIGCDIAYKGKNGYPPLSIRSCKREDLKAEVTIDAGISSQYITALILIAPTLPKGLKINLRGDLVSESYLKLTLEIVNHFGIEAYYDGSSIQIPNQNYHPKEFVVEADWSASSYYYAIVALSKKGSVRLKGLFRNSHQGDAAICNLGGLIGVESSWENSSLLLQKASPYSKLNYDFINQPDIAQTLAVVCAAANIRNDFSGLKTLRIKETDRIDAMNRELSKVNSSFLPTFLDDHGDQHYSVAPGVDFEDDIPRFETYKDHRMAMSLAPLALLNPIEIHKPGVVTKSYPDFYNDLESLGFQIENVG